MLRDKEGNRLFRKITVKVIFPDAIFPPKTFTQHAGPHQGFGPDGIDDTLMSLADKLEELYPFWEFQILELAPVGHTARYVLTFAGYRVTSPNDTTPKPESSAINPQAAEITPEDETPGYISTIIPLPPGLAEENL